jgi:CheY-like chemotaxis protein
MKLLPHHPILLVEDSPEDFDITVRAFRKTKVTNPIFRCADGDEALDFLHQRGDFVDTTKAPRPAFILLDLNLPGTDGREVLIAIKRSDHLKKIPVVILTTSSNDGDIEACYQAGASSYIQKPVELANFLSIVQHLKEYWFEMVLVPMLD